MDVEGFAYVGDQVISMPKSYAKQGRKLIAVLHSCFGGLLP